MTPSTFREQQRNNEEIMNIKLHRGTTQRQSNTHRNTLKVTKNTNIYQKQDSQRPSIYHKNIQKAETQKFAINFT